MKHRPANVVHAQRQRVEPGHQEARLHQPAPARRISPASVFFLAMDAMTSFYFTHVGHSAGPLPPLYVRFSSPACSPEASRSSPPTVTSRVASGSEIINETRSTCVTVRLTTAGLPNGMPGGNGDRPPGSKRPIHARHGTSNGTSIVFVVSFSTSTGIG